MYSCISCSVSFELYKKEADSNAFVKDMDFLAAGIEAVDPGRAGPVAPSLRDGEKIALLPTVRAMAKGPRFVGRVDYWQMKVVHLN